MLLALLVQNRLRHKTVDNYTTASNHTSLTTIHCRQPNNREVRPDPLAKLPSLLGTREFLIP